MKQCSRCQFSSSSANQLVHISAVRTSSAEDIKQFCFFWWRSPLNIGQGPHSAEVHCGEDGLYYCIWFSNEHSIAPAGSFDLCLAPGKDGRVCQ
ncbi:hypothetical protein XELAEV_18041596mg [Xenopus laevis]|uniref:Uncharacterized protein n=1 Tax=Xenopus laevis TaxID=8355 RepID=A0A974H5A6_XENLA|nr:hypothetical protein XELAEV_18041596mg [Xenopus laevis]